MIRAVAVAGLLAFANPGSLAAQCTEAERVALEAFDKAWGEAGRRGDRQHLETVYAANFVGFSPMGMTDRATTISATIRDAEQSRTSPQPIAVPDHYMISCTATTATITHRNTVPAAAGSSTAPRYSRSVHFLEKRGGRWQAVSSTGHALADGAILAYMERDWNEAARKHDIPWYEVNYANYASDVSSRTGALSTKNQEIESMRTDKSVFESLDLSDMNVRVDGNTAVVTGINHVTGRDGAGKPFNRRVRFTDTFVKKDGRWIVWATQGTSIQ